MADEVVIPIRGADEDLQKALEQSLGSLERFAKNATDQAKDLAKEIEQAASGASAFGVAGLAAASAAGAAFAVTKLAIESLVATIQSAVSAVVNFGTAAVSESARYRQAIEDMVSVTGRMGNSAAGTADDIRALAKDINDSTRFTRDQAVEAQRLLVQFDRIDGSQFERTTKAAADLAAAMRQDLGSAATTVGKALQSPEKAAGLLANANIELTDAQQILIHQFRMVGDLASAQEIVLQAVESQYGGLAEQVTANDSVFDSWGDAIKAASESMGDSLVPILDKLTPLLEASIANIEWMADSFVGLANHIGQSGNFIDKAIQGVIDAHYVVMETIATVAAAAQAAWQNTDQAFEFAFSSMAATMVGWWEDTKHMFTSTIPTVLRWFADNWRDIFTDIAGIVQTIATNVLENMRRLIENIVAFLHGDPQRFKFVALTEGFESTLRELPQIAARELTELEIFWQQRAAKSGDILASAFHDNLQGMREMFGLVRREAEDLGELALEGLGGARAPSLGEGRSRQPWMSEEEGVSASIEGMTQLQQRIQSSAASTRTAEEREHMQLIAELERLGIGTKDGLAKLEDGAVGTLEQIRRTDEQGNQILGGILGGISEMNQRLGRMRPPQPGMLAE